MTAPLKPDCAPTQAQRDAPLRIIWLEDGAYVASEPKASSNCVIDAKGKSEHRDSCMVSKAERRATPDEVREWRIRA